MNVNTVTVIGWCWAEACNRIDKGEDITKIEIPDILACAKRDISEIFNEEEKMKHVYCIRYKGAVSGIEYDQILPADTPEQAQETLANYLDLTWSGISSMLIEILDIVQIDVDIPEEEKNGG